MQKVHATEALIIGGRSGVGKTTVGYSASRLLTALGSTHAVIEGDTLDQAHPAPWKRGVPMAQMNLRAIWNNYRRHGYARLIYTNTASVLELDTLSQALGAGARVTGVLLRASDTVADERLARRETGESLTEHTARSRQAAHHLEQASDVVHRVHTDGRTPTDVAQELVDIMGWGQGLTVDGSCSCVRGDYCAMSTKRV